MVRLSILLLMVMSYAAAKSPVYVVLWFDTEDYVDPAADEAVLRIATDLTDSQVRATFKVVGEKARVLEARGRTDVIRALAHHAIGYHSNFHSIQPVQALYLRRMGMLEGAEEFQRRELPGVLDIRRIFGVTPICYGQPGSSWAPQTHTALRHLGIPVYLDDGVQVGLNEQPFWYGGLLNVYHMGSYSIRPDLDHEGENEGIYRHLAEAANHLSGSGGGVISTYFHPTEFANTEFWDAVNFREGAVRERGAWQNPHPRTHEESERCYRILKNYVDTVKKLPDAHFVTAQDLLQLYRGPIPPKIDRQTAADYLREHIMFLETNAGEFSAADLLLAVLGIERQIVDGPVSKGVTTYREPVVPKWLFDRAKTDAIGYITSFKRLPSEVFIGAETLSLPDFTATVAGETSADAPVKVLRGHVEFERYFSTDAAGAFAWPIHPKNFVAPELLELARLQGWTLKPARFQ